VIIDHDLRLVLLHVPKCAGTALRRAFMEDNSRDVVSLFDFQYSTVLQRQVDLAHMPLMDLRHFQEWKFLNRYRVIACIRHPYQRLASACREFLRQKNRESQIQMTRTPPTKDQMLAYLRRLPSAMDAHDLRWVHGFPIHWFTHYGKQPKVDHLIRCEHMQSDLDMLAQTLDLPTSLRQPLRKVAQVESHQEAISLKGLSGDPNLQSLANILHRQDFRCFNYKRNQTSFDDPELKDLMERCLKVGPSHELPLTNLTPQMRWYWGRSSTKSDQLLRPTRNRKIRS
jgi:hypothetical protein